MLTALPAAPEIRGITWRAEDIGGSGIIDRSRATLVLGADGSVSGNRELQCLLGPLHAGWRRAGHSANCRSRANRTCAPSLMNQETRFVEVLGAVRASSCCRPVRC